MPVAPLPRLWLLGFAVLTLSAARSAGAAEPAAAALSLPGGPAMTPVLTQVAALLRSPQAAGAAIVLREILDQPRCRRRRS